MRSRRRRATDTAKRRALLERIAFGEESSETARLKALELLGELDRREAEARPPEPLAEEDMPEAKILQVLDVLPTDVVNAAVWGLASE